MTHEWPLARLVAVWNGLPGVSPLSRSSERKTAIARSWKTLQKPVKPTKASHSVSAKGHGSGHKKMLAREGSKKARILILLK